MDMQVINHFAHIQDVRKYTTGQVLGAACTRWLKEILLLDIFRGFFICVPALHVVINFRLQIVKNLIHSSHFN